MLTVIDSPTVIPTPRVAEEEQRKWQRYENLVQTINQRNSALQWKQGDVALLGEKLFPDTYVQAFQGQFGLAKGTIENRMRVATKFPKDKRLWDVDFKWYEVLQAKDWDTIVEHMDKVEAGYYETREELRAVFRDDTVQERYTTCKIVSISDILLEHFPENTDVELIIKGKSIKIKIVGNEQSELETEVAREAA